MSCRAQPTPLPAKVVTADQYNAVLARLDAEVHARAQLEADLHAARDHVNYLQRRLAEFTSDEPRPSAQPDPFRPAPAQKREDDPVPPFPSQQQKDEPALQQRPSGSQDKEILSHCSDISACKSGARTPDSQSLNKPAFRKSATPPALNGAVKKSKSKKERTAKVKIPGQSRYWTPEEHKLFLEALNKYGHKDLRSISAFVGTRNMTQVRTHSQKYFMRLMREAKRQNPATKVAEDAQTKQQEKEAVPKPSTDSVPPRPPRESDVKDGENGDKYSVPNTCGMTLLCLVGQDTLPV